MGTIHLNAEVTAEMLDAEQLDALILAGGADPLIPNLPGADLPHVHWAPDGEMGCVTVGE
ncbi:hypothetical protein [uncultured Acetobacterium sp.]|uniref:hypothetical protein n=1 Tax=uncultured Acetobacterium sp. TaxID=217139 RepID=UPI0025D552B5|nr:hypothetical protein [uncultured Acetobacterium sp.]